jgi:hypothetical protein
MLGHDEFESSLFSLSSSDSLNPDSLDSDSKTSKTLNYNTKTNNGNSSDSDSLSSFGIVIDAGSSGTRIHVFQYSILKTPQPHAQQTPALKPQQLFPNSNNSESSSLTVSNLTLVFKKSIKPGMFCFDLILNYRTPRDIV